MKIRLSHLTRSELALLSGTIVSCGYFTLFFLYSVFANYWPGPFVDYWIDIPNVEKFFQQQLSWQDLVSAHANVHRLFIPRLLFIADYRFFAGSNTLLILVSLGSKLMTLLLFNHIIRDQHFHHRLILNVLLFAAILNSANFSNVLHNSNMQWDLASVFACFAIYFYSRDLHKGTAAGRKRSIVWAWLLFAGGFLSQAGALPVIFVFVFISLLNKRWLEAFVSFLLVIVVLYLTFAVLPVNEPQKPTYEDAMAMMIFKLKHVAIYVFKMFSGGIYPIDNTHFIFSWLLLAMFLANLVTAHKTLSVYNNIFLNIAVFAFLMMVTIAAARVDFAPNTWAANRYQTNVMVFILALCLHNYLAVGALLSAYKKILQSMILVFSLGSFFITQYLWSNYAVIFGNKVFDAQTYMLTHGSNQYNGASLLPSLQAYDRIAMADPLFQQHGFAWYANKQGGQGKYQHRKQSGEALLNSDELATFMHSCPANPGQLRYNKVPEGEGFAFSVAVDRTQHAFLPAVLQRNTYYAIDDKGTVTGFAHIFINPERLRYDVDIRGYVQVPAVQAIAEISDQGTPLCLYSFAEN